MKKTGEDFYLKIWLYHPHFIHSQIVITYKDCLDFYDRTFDASEKEKEFPYSNFVGLEEEVQLFEWDHRIESHPYLESELTEMVEGGCLKVNEETKIREQSYQTNRLKNDEGEWKHSAIFTKQFSEGTVSTGDISALDYFVYAAKFKPAFPLLMMISGVYLFILAGFILLKRNDRKLVLFLALAGVLRACLSSVVSQSPTVGGAVMNMALKSGGVLVFILSLLVYLRTRLNKRTMA
ncbi:DUF4306 domain-containing protein [Bacillus aerolatus]|nr:DUF4306 domain-containing protein [Bacillus aerolatus]